MNSESTAWKTMAIGAVVTVVRFSNIEADVPPTPANRARMGNSPVARHTLTRATTAAIRAADFDEAFNEAIPNPNAPLVLLENSLQPGDVINLSVQVAPAGVPVSWSVQRDSRPAPDGDSADLVALSPNATPTLTPDGGDPLRSTLDTDAVGSFFIRPFVDSNGNGTFDHNIDREPFILMHLVLIRAQGFQNNSVANNVNVRVTNAAGTVGSVPNVRDRHFVPIESKCGDTWCSRKRR